MSTASKIRGFSSTDEIWPTWFAFYPNITLGKLIELWPNSVDILGTVIKLKSGKSIIVGHATPYIQDTSNDDGLGWEWNDRRLVTSIFNPFTMDDDAWRKELQRVFAKWTNTWKEENKK